MIKRFPLLVSALILLLVAAFVFLQKPEFLDFSDSAKYADVARNMSKGHGYGTTFSFFRETNMSKTPSGSFSAEWISPGMPLSIFVFFKIFGVGDFAVMATSFFYFLITLFAVYLLSSRVLRSSSLGIISVLTIAFNPDLINYATGGASEIMFICEILTVMYLVSLRSNRATLLAIGVLVLMYLTRPQAIIYILGALIFYFVLNFRTKRAVLYSLASVVLLSIFYLLFSRQGSIAVTQNLPGMAVSDSLRGSAVSADFLTLAKKVFYNLYNFYKLLPQIMNPYLFALFVLGMFSWGKDKLVNSLKIASLFIIFATFFVTALTIPFFRYIHPAVPFVYIIAVLTLSEIASAFSFPSFLKISKEKITVTLTALLVIIFAIGPTLGILILDSRFEKKMYNNGKPPIYVVMSRALRDNTPENQVFVTNLDTWGSWYGERQTVWFPLEPKQIINSETGEVPFDGIYLTSYLIDDENYYMGDGWRQIFMNPNEPKKWSCEGCGVIAGQFKVHSVYEFDSSEVYEKTNGKAVLFIKK